MYTAPAAPRLDPASDRIVWNLDDAVPEVRKEFFFDSLLPPSPLPPTRTLPHVVSDLRDRGYIDARSGIWMGWEDLQDYVDLEREDTVFKPLAELFERIRETSGVAGKDPTIKFRCNPSYTLPSQSRKKTSKPDFYGIRTDGELVVDLTDPVKNLQPRWFDVAVAGELKKRQDEGTFVDVSSYYTSFFALHLAESTSRRRTRQRFSGRWAASCNTTHDAASSSDSPLRARRCGYGTVVVPMCLLQKSSTGRR